MLRIIVFAVCITLAFFLLVAAACHLIKRIKEHKKTSLPILQVLIAVDFVAVLLMFLPIYYLDYFADAPLAIIRPFLISVHNSIRVFILDGEFDIIRDSLEGMPVWLDVWYSSISAVLYILSPILTFSAVLSLFKNVFVKLKLKAGGKKDTFVFSEVNERSLVLAKSIIDKYGADGNKALRIIFAGTSDQFCEDHSDLKAAADELQAICVEDSIAELDLSNCTSRLEFFVIGSDESKNLSDTIKLNETYKLRKNTKVFIISSSEAVGVMLDSLEKTKLIEDIPSEAFADKKVVSYEEYYILRRVDENQVFAEVTLEGMDIFEKSRAEMDALPWNEGDASEPGRDKVISVLLLGLGSHGRALLRNLIWYCQMKGYFLEVNVVERTSGPMGNVAGFMHECPGVMDVNNNHGYKGEARYSIKFLEGVDITKGGLDWAAHYVVPENPDPEDDKLDTILRLRRTSMVFVTLGDDELNIGVGIYLRRLMDKITTNRLREELKARVEWKGREEEEEFEKTVASELAEQSKWPEIYAVVYDESKADALKKIKGLKHCKGSFDVKFIGSLNDIYSYGNVFNEANERLGFTFHAAWASKGEEKGEYAKYESFEYFRNSSMAQAMHKRNLVKHEFLPDEATLLACSDEKKKEWEEYEKRIEHIRWCAYVRSVGYEFAGSGFKSARNDRAKWHHDLVPYDMLSEEEKAKDAKIVID